MYLYKKKSVNKENNTRRNEIGKECFYVLGKK